MNNVYYIVNINDNGPHTIFGSGQADSFSYRVESTNASEIVTEKLEKDAFHFEKEIQDFSLDLMPFKKD